MNFWLKLFKIMYIYSQSLLFGKDICKGKKIKRKKGKICVTNFRIKLVKCS